MVNMRLKDMKTRTGRKGEKIPRFRVRLFPVAMFPIWWRMGVTATRDNPSFVKFFS